MVIKVETNEHKKIIFNFEEEILKKICMHAGEFEKIGYLFYQKLSNINEYVVNEISQPHKNDTSTRTYSKICWRHSRQAKKWIKTKNKKYGTIGYYHTHPKQFKLKFSDIDSKYFHKNSKNENIKVYIIAMSEKLIIYFYSYGRIILVKQWTLE